MKEFLILLYIAILIDVMRQVLSLLLREHDYIVHVHRVKGGNIDRRGISTTPVNLIWGQITCTH